jgi:hypothetical protein
MQAAVAVLHTTARKVLADLAAVQRLHSIRLQRPLLQILAVVVAVLTAQQQQVAMEDLAWLSCVIQTLAQFQLEQG